jgi:beta-galactosidase
LEQAGLSWLLSRVIEEAGVQDRRKLPAGVEMTLRSDGTHTWTFILNYSDERLQVKVPLDGINLVTGAVVKGFVSLGSKDVAIVQT